MLAGEETAEAERRTEQADFVADSETIGDQTARLGVAQGEEEEEEVEEEEEQSCGAA